MTNKGLDRKVNDFLTSHTEIEVLDMKFSASSGNIYVAIIYRG